MKYFIGFMITISLIIILLVVSLTGGSKKPQVQTTKKTLVSYYNTDAKVRMIIDGPINADQTHNIVKVTVGRDKSTYQYINGYEGRVVNESSFNNNENSYKNFLYALARVGYASGDQSQEKANYLGYCPLASRYIFEVYEGSNVLQQYWTTSCQTTKTYLGNFPVTLQLFKAQIPNYSQINQGTNI